jgi:cellulose synthase/poly-beta-1,6-N-acetylglucosamine synthase-like glycosyltransferase
MRQTLQYLTGSLFAIAILLFIFVVPSHTSLPIFILFITLFLLIQGYLATRSMLFGFNHRPAASIPPHAATRSFTLIVPARDESEVIGHTINTLSALEYPRDLYEVLVMIRADDFATIAAASRAISDSGADNIKVVQVDGDANNKSYSLNIALHVAKHEIIGIFDAEDEPHQTILQRVNDFMLAHPDSLAVQAPVHLVNLNSSWFSSLSAIEYYYWFTSSLPFFATKNIVPLGGNTIFTKKEIYQKLGIYDESCLTEDADLGIRLAVQNIKVGIIEDLSIATLEESPTNELEVIRQRARWDQGFFQIIEKSDWTGLSKNQKFYALYILTQPIFRHLSFLNMVFAPLLAVYGTIPFWIVFVSFIPGYFLILQLGLYLLGLSALAKQHQINISPWRYVTTLLAFIPYQALLTLATLRAMGKMIIGDNSWDKTDHSNSHRKGLAILNS